MKVTDRVYLVGSGDFGFSMTHPLDCHVYLVDGGSEMALVDAGLGLSVDQILSIAQADGLDTRRIKHLILTHTHADHAGGAAHVKERLDCKVWVSKESAEWLRNGDEDAISLTLGKEVGFYPKDYVFEPCAVDAEVSEGQTIRVGQLEFEVLDTPGHCRGLVTLVSQWNGKTYCLNSDTVFFGGKILLQNIYDCVLQDYVETIRKLEKLSVDVLLPGHLSFSLQNGQRHLNAAAEYTRRLGVPPNLL